MANLYATFTRIADGGLLNYRGLLLYPREWSHKDNHVQEKNGLIWRWQWDDFFRRVLDVGNIPKNVTEAMESAYDPFVVYWCVLYPLFVYNNDNDNDDNDDRIIIITITTIIIRSSRLLRCDERFYVAVSSSPPSPPPGRRSRRRIDMYVWARINRWNRPSSRG